MDVQFPCGLVVIFLSFRFLVSCAFRMRDYMRVGQEVGVEGLPLHPERLGVAAEVVEPPLLPGRFAGAIDMPPYEPPVTRSATRRLMVAAEVAGPPRLPGRFAGAIDILPYEPPVTRSATRRRALMRPVTRTPSKRCESKRPPFSCCGDQDN